MLMYKYLNREDTQQTILQFVEEVKDRIRAELYLPKDKEEILQLNISRPMKAILLHETLFNEDNVQVIFKLNNLMIQDVENYLASAEAGRPCTKTNYIVSLLGRHYLAFESRTHKLKFLYPCSADRLANLLDGQKSIHGKKLYSIRNAELLDKLKYMDEELKIFNSTETQECTIKVEN